MNNGKICVSVCAETADAMIAKIRRAEEYADVVEVRFDCLASREIDLLLKNLPQISRTYLFTFRPANQGGNRDLTLTERLKFWSGALNHYSNDLMIDIECEPSLMLAVDPGKVVRIVSHHDFDVIPEDLNPIPDFTSTFPNSIVKIAGTADDVTDCIPLWKLLDAGESDRRIIPIAMGEAGKWTRILGLAHGAFMTYGSLDEGEETAPGQLTTKCLRHVYRVKDLDPNTRVYGVIGDPVSSSLSPYIHNPAFVSAGVNAVFIPLMVKDLDAFIHRMVRAETREIELNFHGFSVTMPHKRSIMKHLDEIDPTAAAIGAVNTVKIENGKLTGYNTDAYGFIEPLKERFGDLADARVAVLGAGGAARACIFALGEAGAYVTVFARDLSKAEALAGEFMVRTADLDPAEIAGNYDIVVNATPVGMHGALERESLLTSGDLSGVRFVYDLVTGAEDTLLISEAKKAGIPAIGGLEMLIAQAAKQSEIWTGIKADVELMRNSALQHMDRR